MFFQCLLHHISLTVKDFSKIPTVTDPRDPQLEAEILSQKETLISEFRKNIENEKHIIGFKSLTVREKRKRKMIFAIINTSWNFQQNQSKEVVMDINGINQWYLLFRILCDSWRQTTVRMSQIQRCNTSSSQATKMATIG